MEIVYFTLVAIILYFCADFVLRRIEAARAEPLKNRSVVFFVILLVLAVTTFSVIRFATGT